MCGAVPTPSTARQQTLDKSVCGHKMLWQGQEWFEAIWNGGGSLSRVETWVRYTDTHTEIKTSASRSEMKTARTLSLCFSLSVFPSLPPFYISHYHPHFIMNFTQTMHLLFSFHPSGLSHSPLTLAPSLPPSPFSFFFFLSLSRSWELNLPRRTGPAGSFVSSRMPLTPIPAASALFCWPL